MSEFYWRYKKVVWVVVAVVVLIAVYVLGVLGGQRGVSAPQLGIGGGVTSFDSSVSKTGLLARDLAGGAMAQESIIIQPISPEVPASGPIDLDVERKVIKNGSLDMVVKNTEDAIVAIKKVAATAGGFVDNANVWEAGDEKRGYITIRVPSEMFDVSISAVKDMAARVTREDVNAQDVTEQFIDLEAQLKNYKAAEAQYLQVLSRAYTVEDILAVRKELDRVRGDIERLQGRLNYLSRQIAMSTISVSLTSEAAVKVFGIVWSPWNEVKQGLRNMLADVVNFINVLIAFVFKLPLLILWVAILATVVWGLWKGGTMVKRRLW